MTSVRLGDWGHLYRWTAGAQEHNCWSISREPEQLSRTPDLLLTGQWICSQGGPAGRGAPLSARGRLVQMCGTPSLWHLQEDNMNTKKTIHCMIHIFAAWYYVDVYFTWNLQHDKLYFRSVVSLLVIQSGSSSSVLISIPSCTSFNIICLPPAHCCRR